MLVRPRDRHRDLALSQERIVARSLKSQNVITEEKRFYRPRVPIMASLQASMP